MHVDKQNLNQSNGGWNEPTQATTNTHNSPPAISRRSCKMHSRSRCSWIIWSASFTQLEKSSCRGIFDRTFDPSLDAKPSVWEGSTRELQQSRGFMHREMRDMLRLHLERCCQMWVLSRHGRHHPTQDVPAISPSQLRFKTSDSTSHFESDPGNEKSEGLSKPR